MGLFNGVLGNASEYNAEKAQEEYGHLLSSNEVINKAYKLIRDMFIFTNKRLILIDVQGLTGKKIEYKSVPYSKITSFSVETAGHLDLDAELKIWVSGLPQPIQKQFNKTLNIYEVQAELAEHVN
ncbi:MULTISPECIES: PH domain-containing protein [unclassified Sedimentibacter]|uniref:PH domain-containing protein n=1 Tax=unclassified Sedimentibacter TaxID=2649220 RepID=UPI0027DEBAF6|nr:PH domain-containing protein [Sedimentibacter sp. MB35-C1]WMJ78734.1 PH domain-containing protein [Sedimentibacter sp. MB35-C1]